MRALIGALWLAHGTPIASIPREELVIVQMPPEPQALSFERRRFGCTVGSRRRMDFAEEIRGSVRMVN